MFNEKQMNLDVKFLNTKNLTIDEVADKLNDYSSISYDKSFIKDIVINNLVITTNAIYKDSEILALYLVTILDKKCLIFDFEENKFMFCKIDKYLKNKKVLDIF